VQLFGYCYSLQVVLQQRLLSSVSLSTQRCLQLPCQSCIDQAEQAEALLLLSSVSCNIAPLLPLMLCTEVLSSRLLLVLA
jgi:hypothetical protein